MWENVTLYSNVRFLQAYELRKISRFRIKNARNSFRTWNSIILRSRAEFRVRNSRFAVEGVLCKKISTRSISFFLAIHDESPFCRPYRVLEFVQKFRRCANFARMDRWRELVHGKFRMTESVACKFLFTERYIFRDAMLANVSIRERPNNSYSTHLCTDRWSIFWPSHFLWPYNITSTVLT